MRVLFLDTFSGISGNMLLGLLFDLGADQEYVLREIEKLDIGEYKINITRVNKLGIDSSYVEVQCKQFTHSHEHHHGLIGKIGHKLQAVLGHEHGGQLHSHGGVMHSHAPEEQRNLASIMQIIKASELTIKIKAQAERVFSALAEAEAKVHGKSIQEVHFHEVGAIDTIIDVVGCLLAIDNLKIDKIVANRLQTGRGFVNCAHGLMPIPAPATAELLQNMPHYAGELEKELVTPTGAALLNVLVSEFQTSIENFKSDKIGYGAGTWDLPIPNVVRGYLGEIVLPQQNLEELLVLQANIDDMNPEYYEFIISKLLENNCQDVWLTPIIMKKNRPANILNVLLERNLLEKIAKLILQETTSIGLRYYPVQRIVASRQLEEIELSSGAKLNLKIAHYQGQVVNIAPEYADCVKIAKNEQRPLKDVYLEALSKKK